MRPIHRTTCLALLVLAVGCAQGAPGEGDNVRQIEDRDVFVPPTVDMDQVDDEDPVSDSGMTDVAPTDDAGTVGDDGVADLGACPGGCGPTETCTPSGCVDVCAAASAECGDVDGTDCGMCDVTEVCAQNACIDPCGIVGAECGELTWSGETADCGTCSTGTCWQNQCAQPGYRSIDGGFAHTCAHASDGTVDCWGENDGGQLGSSGGDRLVATQVDNVFGIAAVATFNQHGCASKPTGAWCWGGNTFGQLGNGSLSASNTPVVVTGAFDYVQIAAGGAHSCGLRADGTVECWGINGQGQLGTGQLGGQSTTPLDVINLTDIVDVAAGSAHTCALRSDGAVYCWGWNEKGQLGNASSAASTPVRVQALGPAIRIAAGQSHSCAIGEDLEVWCWGDGESGQLGRGSTASSNVPVASAMSNAVRVIAGAQHTCAIDTGRRLWCWGANESGQLGIGSQSQANAPVMVNSLTDVLDGGAGFAHTCATLRDGTAWCWGAGGSGRLGTNATADSLVPLAVQ